MMDGMVEQRMIVRAALSGVEGLGYKTSAWQGMHSWYVPKRREVDAWFDGWVDDLGTTERRQPQLHMGRASSNGLGGVFCGDGVIREGAFFQEKRHACARGAA